MSSSTALDGDLRPDWLGDAPAAPRGRVVRSDDPLVRVVDLPAVEDLDDGSDAADDAQSEHSGAASVTWALGYRNGYQAGHDAGREAGWADGNRAGHEHATRAAFDRYETVLRDLRADADAHLRSLDELTATVAAQATELAFAIAEAVVGRELQLAVDPGADAVRRAIAATDGRADAVARLHPDDLDRLSVGTEELSPTAALRIVADPTVAPGDCVLESGATTVSAGIDAALARVRAALALADRSELALADRSELALPDRPAAP